MSNADLQKGIMANHVKSPTTNDEMVRSISGWIVGIKSFVVIMLMIISSIITGTIAMTRLFVDVEGVQRDIIANRTQIEQVTTRQQGVLQSLSGINSTLENMGRQLDRLEVIHQKP